jgi:hypothetical protein
MRPATTARLALAAAALPVVLGVVAVRPADAQTAAPGYESYSLTALAAGARTAGDVGAGGGLATLDTGSASVSARLDSAPSAAVLAAPYEPGTLFRTVVGQVNAGAGEAVLDVPDAEAQFPGAQTSGELETVPPAEGGPVSSRGGQAKAQAAERAVSGTATGERLVVEGALEVGASSSSVELTADPDRGITTATARTTVARVLVAGVLELRDVVASASITTKGDAHVPAAALTVGGASVAGQEVAVSDEGVTAVGTPVLPGQTLQDLTDQANAALEVAGVQVTTVGTTETATARDATADTGGVAIRLVQGDLPNGIPGNRLDVVVGGVVLTETDALALPVPEVLPPLELPPVDTSGGTAPTTTTIFVPGTPGIPGTPGQVPAGAAPTVAAPPTASAGLVVAGQRLPAAVALAAFAVWQFLSLGTATLYAVVDRRRRTSLSEALL